ncbi:MAG: pantoate--beta-alanine ligase [Chloroflexi bacterium]|nr:pantoate--beta-alanine ligase [Chloroflexota bacterium]
MEVVAGIRRFKQVRGGLTGSIGFVPTMGYLHEGHLSLIRQARADNDSVVASIFVNPTQFGPHEDFASYPRDLARDLTLLGKSGTDYVFTPTVPEMYPEGFATYVEVAGPLTARLEGATRPSHFRGVTTVVCKLFDIVRPTRAYFGQKDAQQALVIKKMVHDLDMNLEVVVMPTVREPEGLAMSSRNVYLKPDERRAALVLSRSLNLAQEAWSAGERDAHLIRAAMQGVIEKEPLATVEYVSVADAATLEETDTIDRSALVSLAVKIGRTRLIDNIILEPT